MAAPPLDAGAVQDTADWVLAFDEAVTAVGTPGSVAGVAGADDADGLPAPTELLATTVKV